MTGTIIFIHKTKWGCDHRDGKKFECLWLSVGDSHPPHTPLDQQKGLIHYSILTKAVLEQVNQWSAGILQALDIISVSPQGKRTHLSQAHTSPSTLEETPLSPQASKKRKAISSYSSGRFKNARIDKLIKVMETASGVDSKNPEQFMPLVHDIAARTNCLTRLRELHQGQILLAAESALMRHVQHNLSHSAMQPDLRVIQEPLPDCHVASKNETSLLR